MNTTQDYLKNICFYGASITKQPKGLVHFFRELNPDKNVYSQAYGGTRIMDAGICHVNKVVDSAPDYCFVEWFSAQMPLAPSDEYLEKCVDTIVRKLLEIDCLPILLLLFRMDDKNKKELLPKRRRLYDNIKLYCSKYNIDYIDLSDHPEVITLQQEGKLMSDVAHTAPEGAQKYAEIINNHFHNTLKYKDISQNIYPPKNDLYSIQEYPLVANISKSIKIYGNGKIIGINQNVGPHSGILEILHSDGQAQKFNSWDQYCFYQRNIISRLDTDFTNWVEIKVSQEEFDKSRIAKPVGVYTLDKMIKSLSIFYTGEIQNIEIFA
jgi:hypothetical protein